MKKNKKKLPFVGLIIFALFIFWVLSANNSLSEIEHIQYADFMKMVESKEVKSILIDLKSENTFTFEDYNGKIYKTDNPKYDNFKKDLLEKGVKVEEVDNKTIDIIMSLLPLLFYGFMICLLVKMSSGQMGKKTEPIAPDKDTKTFSDVAGLKQVKEDVMQLVDFMKNPDKYHDAGAKLPKGVILYGPPGTGKTLLAKAIAGEAKIPFYSIAGSDFIEMFVGLGAKRVRELFENARKHSPCIIFIDELDAIGGHRSAASNNSEQRQTINALLAEMDGFNGSENILVIAATNRLEDLDKALIRPGRFDKHIAVPLPATAEERMEVIKIYSKNKKFAEDVNLEAFSKETLGFSPADIEAVLNEAALISVQDNKRFIDRACIDEAIFKKLMKGHAKDDSKRNKDEIELVAHHEAGHAVIGKLTNMDVSKVTIIPSTSGAGGVNIIIPKKLGLYSIRELKNQVKMAYAGRCAEELLYGDFEDVTTGASSDIQQATQIIKEMISYYGMNQAYGMLNLEMLSIDNEKLTNEAIELSKALYDETMNMLREHKDFHQAIVDVLLEKETISGDELDALYRKFVTGDIDTEETSEINSKIEEITENIPTIEE